MLFLGVGIALCESWIPRGCWYTSTIYICVYYCIICLLVLWSRCILMDEKSCEMQIKYTAKLKVLLLSCRCSCLCCSFCFIMCYEKLLLLLLLSLSFFLIIVYWLVDQCGCLTLQFESWDAHPWDPVFQDSMRRFFLHSDLGIPIISRKVVLLGGLSIPSVVRWSMYSPRDASRLVKLWFVGVGCDGDDTFYAQNLQVMWKIRR